MKISCGGCTCVKHGGIFRAQWICNRSLLVGRKEDPSKSMTFSLCPLDIFCSFDIPRCVQRRKQRERERLVTIHRCVAGTWRQWGCVPGPSGTSPALSTVKNVHTNHACGTCLLAIQCIPLGKSISCYSCLAACLECVFPYLCLWFPYLFSECLPFQGLSLLLNLIGFNHDVPTYLCMRSVFRSEIIHNI